MKTSTFTTILTLLTTLLTLTTAYPLPAPLQASTRTTSTSTSQALAPTYPYRFDKIDQDGHPIVDNPNVLCDHESGEWKCTLYGSLKEKYYAYMRLIENASQKYRGLPPAWPPRDGFGPEVGMGSIVEDDRVGGSGVKVPEDGQASIVKDDRVGVVKIPEDGQGSIVEDESVRGIPEDG